MILDAPHQTPAQARLGADEVQIQHAASRMMRAAARERHAVREHVEHQKQQVGLRQRRLLHPLQLDLRPAQRRLRAAARVGARRAVRGHDALRERPLVPRAALVAVQTHERVVAHAVARAGARPRRGGSYVSACTRTARRDRDGTVIGQERQEGREHVRADAA